MLSIDDKRSRVDLPSWLLNGFRDVVQESGLIENHVGYALIRVRLDEFFFLRKIIF